jgi:hypothetical protein
VKKSGLGMGWRQSFFALASPSAQASREAALLCKWAGAGLCARWNIRPPV